MAPTPAPAPRDKLRALIVDDEAPARDRLRRMLGDCEDVTVIGEASNGAEALSACVALDPDVVLLDIRMPGMDGLETARHLNALEEPPALIFTTAYDEYALDAFESQAVGYLMKPVRREKLERALRQASRVTGTQLARLTDQAKLGKRRVQICTRLGEQLKLVPVEDIWYFAADQKYVTLHHRGGADIIDDSLRALEDEFAGDFVRIHRNSLVALRHIRAVERSADGRYTVRLTECDAALPVSRRHAAEALRQIRGG